MWQFCGCGEYGCHFPFETLQIDYNFVDSVEMMVIGEDEDGRGTEKQVQENGLGKVRGPFFGSFVAWFGLKCDLSDAGENIHLSCSQKENRKENAIDSRVTSCRGRFLIPFFHHCIRYSIFDMYRYIK